MLVNIIKPHHHYSLGEHNVSNERGNYLIRSGIAEEVGIYNEKEIIEIEKEKSEFHPVKEKIEHKKRGPKRKIKE